MLDFLAGRRTRPHGPRPRPAQRALLERLSFEATPQQIEKATLGKLGLPTGTQVYVPRLPGAPIAASAAACARIAAQGSAPVAHLAARSLASRGALDEALGRLAEAGAAALLLIAGDDDLPAGRFREVRDVLATGLVERHGFAAVGFAGHPEGLRHADDAALDRALADKIAWSREAGARIWLVTQFAFAAGPVLDWMERLRARAPAVPVRVGVPGPAKLATLVAYARQCGIGPSARLLTVRPDAARLVGGWRPDAILAELAAAQAADPDLPLAGVHVYAFGGLAAAAAWRREALGGAAPGGAPVTPEAPRPAARGRGDRAARPQ